MKPTTDSIKAARESVEKIAENSRDAAQCLWAAQRLFEHDAPAATVKELDDARTLLVMLRRTQTAALENIDAALDSAIPAERNVV
jgi:hypothetical protein